MKKIRNFVLIALLVLPILVNAESVKDGNITYVLEERKIDCLGEYQIVTTIDKEGNLIFSNAEANEFIKVNEKNECIELTDEEEKVYENIGYGSGSIGYYVGKDENNKYAIVTDDPKYDVFGYGQTTDTELDETPNYVIYDERYEIHVPVNNPVKEDLPKYYEFSYFKSATDEEFDATKTYYVKVDKTNNSYYHIVENPVAEDIAKYYYIVEKPYEQVVIKDLNQEKITELTKEYDGYIKALLLSNDEFVLLFTKKAEDESLVYLFDVNGNKIEQLQGIHQFSKISNGLLLVVKDNAFEIYNTSYKKIFTIESNNLNETQDYLVKFLDDYGYQNHLQFLVITKYTGEDKRYYTIRDYKIIEGENQTYKEGNLTFRFSGLLEKLTKVLVNDVEISKDYYTLASGSTIVTLKKEYLDTLENGTYTLKVEYNDGGSSEAEFKVDAKVTPTVNIPGTPDTYDGITTSIVLAVISSIEILLGAIYIRKHNKN